MISVCTCALLFHCLVNSQCQKRSEIELPNDRGVTMHQSYIILMIAIHSLSVHVRMSMMA